MQFYQDNGRFAFLSPLGWVLGTTYDDHLRLVGKRVVDFLFVLIEVFSLGVTAEALWANIGWSAISLQRGPVDPKFQVTGIAPTNQSSSQKTRLNDISYGIKIWTDLSTVLSQFTCLTDRPTDGQTDSFLIAIPRLHSMQRGNKIDNKSCKRNDRRREFQFSRQSIACTVSSNGHFLSPIFGLDL